MGALGNIAGKVIGGVLGGGGAKGGGDKGGGLAQQALEVVKELAGALTGGSQAA